MRRSSPDPGRRWRLALAGAACALALVGCAPVAVPPTGNHQETQPATPTKSDLQVIQGSWRPQEVVDDGKREGPDQLTGFRMYFEGDKFLLEKDGQSVIEGTFELESTTSPKQINMKFEKAVQDEFEGKLATGIYKIDGDTLIWCITKPGVENRPMDFTSKEGAGRMLATLKRVKQAMGNGKDVP